MHISLVITILNRNKLSEISSFYDKNNVGPVITMLGRGTATKGQLRLLGLEEEPKALIAGVIAGDEISSFFKKAKRELMIDVPGNGVMVMVPIKSVTGGRSLAYITNKREMDSEVPTMNYDHELIVVIANSGNTDVVMDIAREAGAGGGTVIHAKGTGAQLAKKFFGVSLAEEKEVMLIAESIKKKSAIMKAIAQKAGPSTPQGAICFSVPVSEIAGIRMLED